ncbi:aminopeptidase P family protein [Pelagibacterium montanilacus]|uniref:aminopeptidase P family protein n=1 Tax=Pelagibacterium montanilacus TaxID=2185280 RepID=UPI000F8CEF4B|nr:aminopeptidase P family protein [Pelagibacterium montanilacus]
MPLSTPIPPAHFQSFEERSDPGQVAGRLAALREALAKMELDAFLVPRADVHQGEYVPDCDARLAYVTGFTGSAGLAVIGRERAALCVDSRYTLQAPAQTDTDLLEVVDTTTTSPGAWMAEAFDAGSRIGFDPWLHTPSQIEVLKKALDPTGIALMPVENPVDAIWSDRPAAPEGPILVIEDDKAGQSAADKLAALRETMAVRGADALVLTLPESLCWLFNIRGRDIPHNPFVLGFALVPREGAPLLFVAAEKCTQDNASALAGRAQLRDRSEFEPTLAAYAERKARLWFDPASAPIRIKTLLDEAGADTVTERDPVQMAKARKNPLELDGMREAHRLDGIAVTRFLAWFDAAAARGELTEIDVVEMLEAMRRDAGAYDVSFETISGSGPHGAIVHYRVSRSTNRTIVPGELMLVDSGGQYAMGTTDITRTMATGTAGAAERDHFTRVLKGMIAISRARFPKGTTGAQLDILARQFLWQAGLTYNHGTGHGVGAGLSVHEGPAGISPRYTVALEEGMVISNEPGVYLEGRYGIRIENLVAVKAAAQHQGYLEFETLTLAPIDRHLLALELLDPTERDWLNAYHARVSAEIGPDLATDAERQWLAAATAPI